MLGVMDFRNCAKGGKLGRSKDLIPERTGTMNSPVFAILGSGRLARHLQVYLSALRLPFQVWSRGGDPSFNTFREPNASLRLQQTVESATHVLFAVSDRAIEELAVQVPVDKVRVHFSGAKRVDHVYSAHPLMSFGEAPQSAAWYQQIPFILDSDVALKDILPGFPNPSFSLRGDRAQYHALCSLAGNATFLLWREIFEAFERDLKLPRQVLEPFLEQNVTNAFDARQSLTGPVARGDHAVVTTHQNKLENYPELLKIYKSYLHLAQARGFPVEGLS